MKKYKEKKIYVDQPHKEAYIKGVYAQLAAFTPLACPYQTTSLRREWLLGWKDCLASLGHSKPHELEEAENTLKSDEYIDLTIREQLLRGVLQKYHDVGNC